jgi:methionine synthase II (cobalamin-independent)
MSETTATPAITAEDYIAQLREELYSLEAKLERAELEVEQAQRDIDEAGKRQQAIRLDALLDGRTSRSAWAQPGRRCRRGHIG